MYMPPFIAVPTYSPATPVVAHDIMFTPSFAVLDDGVNRIPPATNAMSLGLVMLKFCHAAYPEASPGHRLLMYHLEPGARVLPSSMVEDEVKSSQNTSQVKPCAAAGAGALSGPHTARAVEQESRRATRVARSISRSWRCARPLLPASASPCPRRRSARRSCGISSSGCKTRMLGSGSPRTRHGIFSVLPINYMRLRCVGGAQPGAAISLNITVLIRPFYGCQFVTTEVILAKVDRLPAPSA